MGSRPPFRTRIITWLRGRLSVLAATPFVTGVRAMLWRRVPCVVLTLGLFALALAVSNSHDTAEVPTTAETSLTQVVKDLDKGRVIEVAWTDGDTYEPAATAVVVTDKYSRVVKIPAAYAEQFMAKVVKQEVLVTPGGAPVSKPGHPVDPADAVQPENGAGWVGSLLWILFAAAAFWTVYSRTLSQTATGAPRRRLPRALGGGRGLAADVEVDVSTRFSDVAGCTEAVADLSEMVEYLQDPARFTRLGAKTPRGALLAGPPGTGKTLLARAVAGEAGVAFISVSGSDFVEKYVGVGAKRIRDLFAKAREFDKAIVFIDEVDTIGRRRSTGDSGASQESENTLTALLTELDGFGDRGNILVIAATNRADMLDEAVVRPGRLERRINVPNPDRYGREQILAVHAKGRPVAADVDLTSVARRTPGFSGAQMEAIVNEACMIAARGNRDDVNQECFDFAIATIAMGRARESALVTDFDRKVTAWHEAGHALCAYLIDDADDPVQITIVPRGPAGGVTWMSGSDDIYLRRRTAHARLVVAMGGRVGEELFLDGEYTQGASGDLVSATQTATQMVTQYGMTDLGYVVRDTGDTPEVLAAVNRLLEDAHVRATDLLTANRAFMSAVVGALLEEETLTLADIEAIAEEYGVSRVESFALPAVPARKPLTSVSTEPTPVAAGRPVFAASMPWTGGRGVLSRVGKALRTPVPGAGAVAERVE